MWRSLQQYLEGKNIAKISHKKLVLLNNIIYLSKELGMNIEVAIVTFMEIYERTRNEELSLERENKVSVA